MAKDYTITAESKPDYDDWGWDDYWSANDWLLWHRALKAKYGLTEANIKFLTAWSHQGMFAKPIDARTFSSDFKRYARENDFYRGLYDPSVLSMLLKTIGAGVDVIEGGTEIISDTGKTLPAIGKIIKYGVPILLITLIFGAGWWAYNNFIAVKRV